MGIRYFFPVILLLYDGQCQEIQLTNILKKHFYNKVSTLLLPKWINAMHLHLFSLNSFWGGKLRRSNILTILIRDGRAANLQQHYLLNNTLIHSPLSRL